MEIGYIFASPERAASVYVTWQNQILTAEGMRMEMTTTTGQLSNLKKLLHPRTVPIRLRYLFADVGQGWTGFWDNGGQGTDAGPVVRVLSESMHCRAIRALMSPDVTASDGSRVSYGGVAFELFSDGVPVRILSCVNDGGTWVVDEMGEPLEFEKEFEPISRKKADRFTPRMLRGYLEALGVMSHDDPDRETVGIICEKRGKIPSTVRVVNESFPE